MTAIVVVGVALATIILVATVMWSMNHSSNRIRQDQLWDDGGQSLRDLKALQAARKAGRGKSEAGGTAGAVGFWGIGGPGNYGGCAGGGCGGGGCGGGGCGGGCGGG
jgi:hypothetical protein